jgi:hypothetical protein
MGQLPLEVDQSGQLLTKPNRFFRSLARIMNPGQQSRAILHEGVLLCQPCGRVSQPDQLNTYPVPFVVA